MIAFIWAQAADGIIGFNGHLPWHLPDDLHYFRERTAGQLMVVGRKTYESFPHRPLPDRTNIVLTHHADYDAPGATVVTSKAAVLGLAQAAPEKQLIIAGGAEIFDLFMPEVDTLWVTRLQGAFHGDTRMPAVDYAAFTLTETKHVDNPSPQLIHDFETWVRKTN